MSRFPGAVPVEPSTSVNRFGAIPVEPAAGRRRNKWGDVESDSPNPINRFGDKIEFDFGDASTAVVEPPAKLVDASADDLLALPETPEPPDAESSKKKFLLLYDKIKSDGETPELKTELEKTRTEWQAAAESENRSWIEKSLPYRSFESAAKSIKAGNETIVAEGAAGVAGFVGAKELRDSLRGVSKRIQEQTASAEFVQSQLDREGLLGTTLTGWTRQAMGAVGEAALAGGGRSGLRNLATYYGAKSAAESHAQGKSFSESAIHGLIEGAFTLAGGKVLGAGTGQLAGAGREVAETTADKIAAYLAERTSSKLGKALAKIGGASSAEVVEEVGTEMAHYLTEVGFGDDFNVKELTNRLINAAGPAAIAGGGAKAVHTAINGFGSDVAKLRADVKKAPNNPKVVEAAERAIVDSPPDAVAAPTSIEATPNVSPEPPVSDTSAPPVAAENTTEQAGTSTDATGETTSARKADMAEDRELFGLDELPEPQRRTWQFELDTAKANGTAKRALELARDISIEPRAFSPVETAGLVLRAAELKREHANLSTELAQSSDAADVRIRSAEINRFQDEFDTISQALRTSGTEKGRALAAQKLTINQDFDLVSVTSRAKAAKGAELSDAEKSKLSDSVKQFDAAQKAVDDADKQERHREVVRVRRAIKSIRRTVGLDPTNEKSDVPGLSDTDKQDLAELATALREAEAKLGTVDSLARRGKVHNRPSEVEVSTLDDTIAAVQAAIKTKRPTKQTDSAAVEQKRIDALAKKLDDARKTLADLKAGKPNTKSTPNRRADVASEERTRLQFELDKARREISQQIRNMKPKSLWGHIQEPFHLSRTLVTSLDVSAVLRQGGFVTVGHPLMAAKSIRPMFQAMLSEQKSAKINADILARPNAPLYERAGLYLHRDDTDVSAREESYMSKWAEKLPGIGPAVAGSQRAYTTFLNKLRADTFDTLSATLARNGEPTLDESRAIANYINVATGRGGLGRADFAMNGLSAVFFAPRYTLSRFQLIAGQPIWGKNARSSFRVQKQIAEEYGRYLIGMGVIYATAAAAWGDEPWFGLSFDPRSPEFGKIRLGNTRLDPLSGLSQATVFLARMASARPWTNGGECKTCGARTLATVRTLLTLHFDSPVRKPHHSLALYLIWRPVSRSSANRST